MNIKIFLRFTFIFVVSLTFNLRGQDNGYVNWLKRRDTLKEDKSVVRYYTFEDVKDSQSIVKDLSDNKGDLKFIPFLIRETKEKIDDLQVIEGRWPEKKAVRLDQGWYQGIPVPIENKQFTLEVWFRKNGPGSIMPEAGKGAYIVSSPPGWGSGWRLITEYKPAHISFDIGIERNNIRAKSDKMYSDGIWHYVAATWDGKIIKLYVDGLLVSTAEYEGEYIDIKQPFRIGFRSGGSALLDIDEVVIYNRVLDIKEIETEGKGFGMSTPDEVFLKADAYIKEGNFKKARAEYEKLKHLPSFGKEYALFNISESYRLEKDYFNSHKTFEEIQRLKGLSDYYRIYALFQQAEVYLEDKNYKKAREIYQKVTEVPGALEYHIFTSQLKVADTYKDEKKHSVARGIYEKLLRQEELSLYPHEGYRHNLIDRLEQIEGVADGRLLKTKKEKFIETIMSPRKLIYVSTKGVDTNSGTEKSPFKTIKRAQEEVRKIKEKGLPTGGIKVVLREGKYFLDEGLYFGKDDSGTEDSPIVYSSYPKEKVRIIGGKQITNFKPLTDKVILEQLPKESKGKIWVSDLKELGITEYGQLAYMKGDRSSFPHGMELFFNSKPMWLARWPNEGYARVAGIKRKDGEMRGRGPYQIDGFVYSDTRHDRWVNEKDVWLNGYWYFVYSKDHIKVKSIDTVNKTISMTPNRTSIGLNVPYFAYNILCELDNPGEWYLDRDTGKLYFFPPEQIANSEIIVSTLQTPIVLMKEASNIVFSGITVEATQVNGVEIEGGRNNLIVSSSVKNIGQWGVVVNNGWEHSIVGCDIFDTGAGGISLTGGDRVKLIPSRHLVENNYIHHFNRFDGGYRQGISIDGMGQRVSHNLLYDSPMQGIYFNAMDHIIEYNELHDVVHEGRELGSMYVYGAHNNWRWMNRGTVIRNNFMHHISYRSSPNLTQGLNCIHVDGRNGGMVIEKNIFYTFPNGISCSHPDMRLENNLLIEAERSGISVGERGMDFFFDSKKEPISANFRSFTNKLVSVNYKQPPWSYRFPQLFFSMQDETPMRTKNTIIERNINTGGRFLGIGGIVREDNIIRNNWDGEDLLFIDRENMDFRLRPGSPAYGLTGAEPIDINKIGLYKDELRVTWPISRTKDDIGKYHNVKRDTLKELQATTMVPLQRVSEPLTYTVPISKKQIKIDGKLDPNEWGGLDIKKAIIIEQHFRDGKKQEAGGARSYAWLQYDNQNLYVATKHKADPYIKGMPYVLEKFDRAFIEVSIEGQMGPLTNSWWSDDMLTGPIYIIGGYFKGNLEVINKFSMPYEQLLNIEKSIEYKVSILDEKNAVWVSEMRIPFSALGIKVSDVDKLSFNLGTYKRSGLFAWVATGDSFWRVENAGFIKFEK